MNTMHTAAAQPLARFVARLEELTGDALSDQRHTVDGVVAAMRDLVADDRWLNEAHARPHPQYYQQYLLHADPRGRFSVVSFVWGPGQKTPVHDHGTWGVIGMLRGAEIDQAYRQADDKLVADSAEKRLEPGDTAVVSPATGDIHMVRNAFDDRVSVSIHAYGTDIGQQRRHVFDLATGVAKAFVSGYANVAKEGA